MYQKLLTFILLTLFSSSVYATDLNNTEAILAQASEATESIQAELNSIIEGNSTEEKNSTQAIKLLENNTSHLVTTITTTPLPIAESNVSIEENNSSSALKNTLNLTKGISLKGKKIFIQHFKKVCETTSYKFAGNYAQEEWEEIAESGKFQETMFKLCPNIQESYNKEWSSDLYQFFYEHANDSENIPEC